MSVCHSCGQPHDAGALHCGFCGARLSQPTRIKKTMLGMAALSAEDLPRAASDAAAPTLAAPAALDAPPAMPPAGEAAWPDPEDWGLEDTPAVAANPQALVDTLEASREEVLRQIALDAELAQGGGPAATPTPTPPPLEAPSRAVDGDEALADTLEASRDVMQRAMAELDDAPSPSAPTPAPAPAAARPSAAPLAQDRPDPKTIPVASLAPDRASMGGASWQGDLSLPSEERARLAGPRELGGQAPDAPPPALKTTHWVLVAAIVLVFVGALLLAVAYFALLR